MRIFVDTEFVEHAMRLISVGLVTEDGREFYAEADKLPAEREANDFANNAVIPLLDRGHCAMDAVEMTTRLRLWLAGIDDPQLLYDHDNDGIILRRLLNGEGLMPSVLARLPTLPDVVMTKAMRDHTLHDCIDVWFEAHPDRAARRHHALVDARALRSAVMELINGVIPPVSEGEAREIMASIGRTHAQDAEMIRAGVIAQQALSFMPREMAEQAIVSRPRWPVPFDDQDQ